MGRAWGQGKAPGSSGLGCCGELEGHWLRKACREARVTGPL